MGEQNETGSEGEYSEHIGPAVFGRFRGCGDDPELAIGMVDEGDGMTLGGTDGPTPAEEVELLIGVEAAREVEGEVKVEEAGIGAGTRGVGKRGHENGSVLDIGYKSVEQNIRSWPAR